MTDTTDTTDTTDAYAPFRPTTEGRVYNLTGGDWDQVFNGTDPIKDERLVLNMGPQHPSTHGVLRLILEIEGESKVPGILKRALELGYSIVEVNQRQETLEELFVREAIEA